MGLESRCYFVRLVGSLMVAIAMTVGCAGGEEVCREGTVEECVCPTGGAGEQVCHASGEFGECTCLGRGGPVDPLADAGEDVGPTDTGRDVTGLDAGPEPDIPPRDVGGDGSSDAMSDLGPEVRPDADPDTGRDADPDTIGDAEPDPVEDVSPDPDADPLPDVEPDVRPPVGPLPACSSHGASCDDWTDTTEDFFCAWSEGVCMQRCNFIDANFTESEDCPVSSFCMIEITADDLPDGLGGACQPGDCSGSIFDPRGCTDEQTCVPVGNGASYCVDAGDVPVGGECGVSDRDDPPADDLCEPGLMCLLHECVEPCRIGASCEGDEACVGVFDTTPVNRPGACATECPEFGSCGTGICEAVFGRFGVNAWICDETVGARGAEGEPCEGPRELCEGGLVCLDLGDDEFSDPRCTRECRPPGAEDCGASEICVRSPDISYGFCLDECDPYPRGADRCGPTDMCIPFVTSTTSAVEPDGYCAPDSGTVGPGGRCSNDGFLGGDCEDFGLCIDLEDDGSAECLPLCDPFASGECLPYPGMTTCSSIPPLLGELRLSFCVDAQPGSEGSVCFEEGAPCSEDGTICLDMTGFGAECHHVCRVGFPDCRSGSCRTDGLNPDVVPPYMGLCR